MLSFSILLAVSSAIIINPPYALRNSSVVEESVSAAPLDEDLPNAAADFFFRGINENVSRVSNEEDRSAWIQEQSDLFTQSEKNDFVMLFQEVNAAWLDIPLRVEGGDFFKYYLTKYVAEAENPDQRLQMYLDREEPFEGRHFLENLIRESWD